MVDPSLRDPPIDGYQLALKSVRLHPDCTCVEDTIDYRCANGRFLMSPRGMAVSNTRYLSSSETRVNADIKGRKLHLSESTSRQESVGGICFTNK